MRTISASDPVATTLFGGLRRELLALLFRDPERSYYLRELVKLTGGSPGTLQREVGALTAVGLLLRSRRGRQVFYQANRGSPVFPELQSLLDKTMGVGDLIRNALAPYADHIEAAILFGSFAKGTPGADSDVDVLVVGEVDPTEVSDALAAVEERVGREINPVVYTTDDFRRRVSEGGHFATSVIASPHVALIGEIPDESRSLAREWLAQATRDVAKRDRRTSRRRRPGSR